MKSAPGQSARSVTPFPHPSPSSPRSPASSSLPPVSLSALLLVLSMILTVIQGTKAPQAAGVIHTDFEKNFVCGEIMRFEDLKELGSEAAVRAAGKYITKGKEYEVLVRSPPFLTSGSPLFYFRVGGACGWFDGIEVVGWDSG
jgi:hypothetical protein